MKFHLFAPILFLSLFASQIHAQRIVSGAVLNNQNEPLVGVTVLLKGTDLGTFTSGEGKFSMEIPKEIKPILEFSFVGFEKKIVELGPENTLTVQMEVAEQYMDEVVVIGYGDQSKKKITSSISTAGEEIFENVSTQNFQSPLSGRIPGLFITQASGSPGADVSIRIRGVSSINSGNQPLFVVDGLITTDGLEPFYWGGYVNPLININSNDIESISVLKGAAASAIYGSRGSNGVILITTKQGKFNQKPNVNIGYYAGWSEPTALEDLMNGKEYAEGWNQAAENAGFGPSSGWFFDVESQPSTDWLDLVTRKGFVQELSANVSGGTDQTRYYIGGTYRDENSFIRERGLKRYSFRTNFEQVINEKFRVGLSLNPSRTEARRFPENDYAGPYSYGAIFFPNVDPYDENGQLRGGPIDNGKGISIYPGTPLNSVKEESLQLTTSQVILNAFLSYSPLKNLELKTSLGSEFTQMEQHFKSRGSAPWGAVFGGGKGMGQAGNDQVFNYNWTTQVTYSPDLEAGHSLKLEAGVDFTKESYTSQFIRAKNFVHDDLKFLDASSEILNWTSSKTDAAFQGYFARINYAFLDKYLLTVTGRYDGSSRFGKENRYGFFPALSAGWIISEEDFFSVPIVHFLKLRSSFGLAGNAAIGNFVSKGLIGVGSNYNDLPGFRIVSFDIEDLGWEKNLQWDGGIEFGLWNDRLTGSVEYYIKNTKDLLLSTPIPATNGISAVLQNAGSVRNQGLEFQLSADILSGPLTWNVTLNGATVKNEITALVDNNHDGLDDDFVTGPYLFRVGEPVASWYLVEYAGVDPGNGDALFYDLEGNTVVNDAPSEYRKVAGNAIPNFMGGVSTSIHYKRFDLSVFFQFATGYQIYDLGGSILETNFGAPINQRSVIKNAWTPENPNTKVPQSRLFQVNGRQTSTRYLQDGDYIRLRNFQVGYTFKSIGKSHNRLRIFAAGQNLWMATKFKGPDPEANLLSSEIPQSGYPEWTVPQARTYTFGFNLKI